MTIARLFIAVAMCLTLSTPGMAASTNSTCSNDMICGGVSSRADLAAKIKANDALAKEFKDHGVTAANVVSDDTVNGFVTEGGRVIITKNGKDVTVATDAQSYGRQNMSGSKKVGGLYRRPTAISFKEPKLPALVHMHNDVFVYAIIKSCGNLVTAKPTVSTPTPKQSKATVQQPAPIAATVIQTQVQAQTQAQAPVVAPTTAPVTPPTITAAVAATPAKALPDTGPVTSSLGGLSLLLTTGWYWRRSKQNLSSALRRR